MIESLNNMQGLDNLFQLIADKLGVAVEFVEQNAMHYILEYGKFAMYTRTFSKIGTSLIFALLSIAIVCAFVIGLIYEGKPPQKVKKILIGVSIVIIFGFTIFGLQELIIYNVCPEAYSIYRVIRLMQ